MRSVFVFHPSWAGQDEVSAYLDKYADRKVDDCWQVGPASEPILFITVHNDTLDDFEAQDLSSVADSLGETPALMTMVDVSGRVDGYEEVTDLVVQLLNEFGGVAQDDHSSKAWTACDVVADRRDVCTFFRGRLEKAGP